MIVGIDGLPVSNYDDLMNVLENRRPGDEVKVEYLRDGEAYQTSLVLAAP